MDGDHSIKITFIQDSPPEPEYVTVTVNNEGPGIINDSILDLTCQNTTCSYQFEKGTVINLVANPLDPNSYEFSGWKGLCSGSGNCVHTLNDDGNISAVFTSRPPVTLTINIIGKGTVSDNSLSFSCKYTTCNQELDFNSNVNLTASAETGYEFDRWEIDCQGSSSCFLTMDSNQTVAAVFTQKTSSTTVSWNPPSQREDGTTLDSAEIKKYIIYYGTNSGIYDDAIEVVATNGSDNIPTELIIEGLLSGVTYYFAGVTIDTNNLTSNLSNEISRVISQ